MVGRDGPQQQFDTPSSMQPYILVPISDPIDFVADHCGFAGLAKDCL